VYKAEATMEALINVLKELQADTMNMYAQSHGYHWNVEGRMFKQDHAFFLEIYEDLFDAVDPFAENIRKLGAKAPFGLSQLKANSDLEINDSVDLTAGQMLVELIRTNTHIIAKLKTACDVADASREQSVLNFLADRLDKHEFWQWQLTASSKTTIM
jgi:starvation-inducible DNA-binding protein